MLTLMLSRAPGTGAVCPSTLLCWEVLIIQPLLPLEACGDVLFLPDSVAAVRVFLESCPSHQILFVGV